MKRATVSADIARCSAGFQNWPISTVSFATTPLPRLQAHSDAVRYPNLLPRHTLDTFKCAGMVQSDPVVDATLLYHAKMLLISRRQLHCTTCSDHAGNMPPGPPSCGPPPSLLLVILRGVSRP